MIPMLPSCWLLLDIAYSLRLLSSQEALQPTDGAGAGPAGLGEGIRGSVTYQLCDLDTLLKWERLFPFP